MAAVLALAVYALTQWEICNDSNERRIDEGNAIYKSNFISAVGNRGGAINPARHSTAHTLGDWR